jgi:hypothetical protein
VPGRAAHTRGSGQILTATDATAGLRAATALQRYIAAHHLDQGVIVGPDSGLRFNYRAGRFVKSYTRRLPWRDDHCYLQAQGYWTLANWRLAQVEPAAGHDELAIASSRGMIDRQRPDGAWEYPNPEWRGRVANAEGSWASIGLLETYRQTADARYLDAALRWHAYLEAHIGWQPAPGGEAVNYFGDDRPGPAVPNNSALVLRLLAELADATGDDAFLARADAMVTFVAAAQRPTGELPYQVSRAGEPVRLEHFQCYQYNAFQAIDLARFEELTGDARVADVVAGVERFLGSGVARAGTVPYACETPQPSVTYHLGAVTAALAAGARRGAPGCAAACGITLPQLLARQREDGSFPHSRADYRILSDRRSYPRNLAMILVHLLDADPSAPR